MRANQVTPLLLSLTKGDELSITDPYGSVNGWNVIHLQTKVHI